MQGEGLVSHTPADFPSLPLLFVPITTAPASRKTAANGGKREGVTDAHGAVSLTSFIQPNVLEDQADARRWGEE